MDLHNSEFDNLLNQYKVNRNKPLMALLYMYKGNWGKLILSVLFFIIKHSPVWVMPIVTANIIDIVSNPGKYKVTELGINLLIAVITVVQNLPTQMLHMKYLCKPVRYVEAELRSNLIRKLQMMSISSHNELKSGKLQSKILRDVEAIQFLSMQIYSTLLPVVFNILVALVVTLSKSFKIALFYLVTIPISIVITRLFQKNIRTSNKEFRKEIEEMSSNVAEMVEMVPLTKAHGLEKVEIRKMENLLRKVKDKGYHLDIITALFGACSWVTFQVFQLICLAFTGFEAYKGNISVGDVVLYQGYFNSILNQISTIINTYPVIIKGIESINSVGEILLIDDVEENRGKKKVKEIKGDFNFNNVTFSYKTSREPVLNNFNLNVKRGECIAFVGESGAGKTTIINLIIGFYKATRGKILLDSVDIAEIDLRSYREHIAVVPQNTILFSGTIRDNITYGLSCVSEDKINKVIEYANLRSVIDKLPNGVNTKIGEHGGMLSGGQRQRIAIARALIRDPQVIILDEATSALDSVSESEVQKALNNLIKNRTTFIVAHRLSTIKDADYIAVVKDGQCVEYGNYDELVKMEGYFYRQLYN